MTSFSINKSICAVTLTMLVLFSGSIYAGWNTPPTPTETSVGSSYLTLTTDAQRGRWIWLKNNCAGCHGDNAKGGMGPNIQFKEIGNVKDAVTGGAGGMTPYPNITTTDMTMLTIYLNSFGKAGEPKFICWWKSPINDLLYNGSGTRPNCN